MMMMMRGMDDFFSKWDFTPNPKRKNHMDDFFPNGISHQIQKEKTILSMMMKMMRGMDDFFSKWDFTPIPKRKNHMDDDEGNDDERNG